MKVSGSKLVVLSGLVVALSIIQPSRVNAQGKDAIATAKIHLVSAPTNTLFGASDQIKPDIAKAKADLVKAGVDISGPCGAFKIVQLAVWRATDGAGLLIKTTGNNCQGYATDIVAYPDGSIFDVLIDGGGANTPAWNSDGTVDKNRVHDPVDPHFDFSSSNTTSETKAITQANLNAAIAKVMQHDDENTAKVQQQIDQVVKNAEATGSSIWKWLGPILIGLGGASAGILVH